MQHGTDHVSDLCHIVPGTVLFMCLISSHFVQRDILYSRKQGISQYIFL
jgi:hypothetical protein